MGWDYLHRERSQLKLITEAEFFTEVGKVSERREPSLRTDERKNTSLYLMSGGTGPMSKEMVTK